MESNELPSVIQTTKKRRRSRRRRVIERFALVLGLPSLLFAVAALSAGVIEYIPSTTTDVQHRPVEVRKFEEPEMVDLSFDASFSRNSADPRFDWTARRERFGK